MAKAPPRAVDPDVATTQRSIGLGTERHAVKPYTNVPVGLDEQRVKLFCVAGAPKRAHGRYEVSRTSPLDEPADCGVAVQAETQALAQLLRVQQDRRGFHAQRL